LAVMRVRASVKQAWTAQKTGIGVNRQRSILPRVCYQ
jgi:hypothetical protein